MAYPHLKKQKKNKKSFHINTVFPSAGIDSVAFMRVGIYFVSLKLNVTCSIPYP